jgi:hypothetical protein
MPRKGPPGDNRNEEPLKDDRGGVKREPLGSGECRLGEKTPNPNGAAPRNEHAENNKNQNEIPGERGKIHGREWKHVFDIWRKGRYA